MKAKLAVVGVSALAMGVFAVPASADRIPSNLTITLHTHFAHTVFGGTLITSKAKCRGNRKVTIMRRFLDTGFQAYDSDKTNSTGRYLGDRHGNPFGFFKAVVKPVTRRGDTCGGDTSRTFHIDS